MSLGVAKIFRDVRTVIKITLYCASPPPPSNLKAIALYFLHPEPDDTMLYASGP